MSSFSHGVLFAALGLLALRPTAGCQASHQPFVFFRKLSFVLRKVAFECLL
jgi:hypothetical protein